MNLVIAVIVSGVLGVVSPALGVSTLGLSLGTIYFRGYLVPGTPAIAKRYFPDSVLRLFDKHQPIEPTNRSDIDPETVLRNANIIHSCEQNDDLCLTEGFHEGWLGSIKSVREINPNRQQFASLLNVNADHVSIRNIEGAYIVSVDDARLQQWESKAALLADLGAERELTERYSQWNDFGPKSRVQVLLLPLTRATVKYSLFRDEYGVVGDIW